MKYYNKSLFPFESRFLNINGQEIHYVDEGVGPTILVSHAPVGSSFMYRNLIKDLSRDHRCIALDYPGFGLSPMGSSAEVNLPYWSKILFHFIHKMELSNIILLGHDTGGAAAFKVVADHSSLFAGVIISDAVIYPVQEYPRLDRMLKFVGSSFFQWVNAWTNLVINLTLRYGIPTRRLSIDEVKEYRRIFDSPEKRRRITQMLSSLRKEKSVMEYVKIEFENNMKDKPILLLNGDKDPVYELGIPDRIRESCPLTTLKLIAGEGHFPHEGQPGLMAEHIRSWISDLSIMSRRGRLVQWANGSLDSNI